MSAPKEETVAEQPKAEEAPKAEEGKDAKPASKFSLGSKFGGHSFGKITPKPVADKASATAAKEEAVDDSHTEAPSSAAEQADPDSDEDALFNDRAMLYRFDKNNNEWKERGVGFMKILQNKETKMCRILMRRNQTFKVCANHFILPHMELKLNQGSDRAYMWNAVDFADGPDTPSHDVLSVKFRNAETANAFKKAFEEGRTQNAQLLKEKEAKEEKKE
ncbi:RanBP1 domain containing protein [Trichomonas vaginalis G3]|uniref:RanBP1 domain containing protein n=1 Tax=Trichomonas vaginalis (strain ATCC PRA-98 / G3) TaxID=412133 RepID=A2FS14_TRIV3|nr:Ran GTPase binding [Trichomonas vaginalis G3]EAX92306.1 RanBP1 domain containing protein [Trichomonas vaginalis G3]KAI5549760.1 Ran GTPase binding [Trichomonas vaginalis G3]|eukprot:XP_001305236.1 RanBP1 domain containing protein [Trichomonas vaginalis G3]